MSQTDATSLCIFQRNLRVHDNQALIQCLRESKQVYCVFIFTPEQVNSKIKSCNAIQFMCAALERLATNIPIKILYGDNVQVVDWLVKKYRIQRLYCAKDYSAYAVQRESMLSSIAPLTCIEDIRLVPDIYLDSGGAYVKFTPYYAAAAEIPVPKPQKVDREALKKISELGKTPFDSPNKKIFGDFSMYRYNNTRIPPIANTLQINKSELGNYYANRNNPSISTSRLSAYNHFGVFSIRELYWTIQDSDLSQVDKTALSKQLYWRDFYYNITLKNPDVGRNMVSDLPNLAINDKWNRFPWSDNMQHFDLWCRGCTGVPIVDAGMRELRCTGYMHNRVRMITASFLIKNLHINWTRGEQFFAQHLVDYDFCQNNGNWRWVLGDHNFRPISQSINPFTQMRKYSGMLKYIRKWVPTLVQLSDKELLNWDKYSTVAENIEYPKPIVDIGRSIKEFEKKYNRL